MMQKNANRFKQYNYGLVTSKSNIGFNMVWEIDRMNYNKLL